MQKNLATNVSQGSVVTCLRCDMIFKYDFFRKFNAKFDAKELTRIGRHWAKVRHISDSQ